MADDKTFRLQTLLQLRQQREKQRQRELGELLTQQQAQNESIRASQQRIVAENQVLRRQQMVGELNLRYLADHRRFLTNLQQRIVGDLKMLGGIQKSLDRARLRLVEASQQKRVLEKLQQRRLDAYRRGQERAEIREADEMSLQLYQRYMHTQAWT